MPLAVNDQYFSATDTMTVAGDSKKPVLRSSNHTTIFTDILTYASHVKLEDVIKKTSEHNVITT